MTLAGLCSVCYRHPPPPNEFNILVERSRQIRQIGQVAAGRGGAIHVQIKIYEATQFVR